MLSYQTFISFPSLCYLLTLCCSINFVRLIKLMSYYKTFVIFSPFVIYSLFTLPTHPRLREHLIEFQPSWGFELFFLGIYISLVFHRTSHSVKLSAERFDKKYVLYGCGRHFVIITWLPGKKLGLK